MSVSPSTTAIAFAPAEPSRATSQSRAWATMIAASVARFRETTSRGLPSCRGGVGGGVPVERTMLKAGSATAPAVSMPSFDGAPLASLRSHSAMCTAQSARSNSEYSCVPSSGSMIQTRSAVNRLESSAASSERIASSGRCSANASSKNRCAAASPTSFANHVDAPSLYRRSRTASRRLPVSSAK